MKISFVLPILNGIKRNLKGIVYKSGIYPFLSTPTRKEITHLLVKSNIVYIVISVSY